MQNFWEYTKIHSSSNEIFLPINIFKAPSFKNKNIRLGGISVLKGDTIIQREKNRPFHIFILTIAGKGKFVMEDGNEIELDEGEFFFSAARGQGHKHFPISSEWTICWLQIEENSDLFISPPQDWHISRTNHSKEIYSCFESIISEELEQNTEYIKIEESQLNLILLFLKREIEQIKYSGKNNVYLSKFISLWKEVNTNISLSWDTPMLCEYMGLSKTHLVRLCNDFYHTSPAKKVHSYKMEHAYMLLTELDYTVSNASEAIGFNSVSSFTYSFKKYFGFLPTATRIQTS